MLQELEKMQEEIEAESGDQFSEREIAYLEQITAAADLGNYDLSGLSERDAGNFRFLVVDAAVVMGLSDGEAEALIVKPETKVELPEELSEELQKQYKNLVSGVNILTDIVYDAEYQMTEEVGAGGFASSKTRSKVQAVRDQLAANQHKLEVFKYENQEFVARFKVIRQEEKAAEAKELTERFWNF